MQRERITFHVSVSTSPIRCKETYNWNSINYNVEKLDLSQLASFLQEGYAINSVFTHDKVTSKCKTKENFKQSNIVAFDFDVSPLTLEELSSNLEVQPTLSYRTPSDGEKGNRFRLIYAFSEPITSPAEYTAYYEAIKRTYFADSNTDDSMKSGVQNIGGAKAGTEVICTHNVFSKADFTVNIEGASKAKRSNGKDKPGISNEILNDVESMPFHALVEKYREIYPYITHTALDFKNGYAKLPAEYYEIKRRWARTEFTTTNGDTKTIMEELKVNDGEGRRRKMFIQCLLRRKMCPEITLEHMFLNLVYERQYYFSNSDNQLTNKILLNICNSAMKVENINIKPTEDKRAFVVDKCYWAKRGMNANAAKQVIKKGMKYEMIAKYYHPEKTDKQNLEILKANGVKCGLRTLKNFRKEQGLTKYKTK